MWWVSTNQSALFKSTRAPKRTLTFSPKDITRTTETFESKWTSKSGPKINSLTFTGSFNDDISFVRAKRCVRIRTKSATSRRSGDKKVRQICSNCSLQSTCCPKLTLKTRLFWSRISGIETAKTSSKSFMFQKRQKTILMTIHTTMTTTTTRMMTTTWRGNVSTRTTAWSRKKDKVMSV